MTSSKAFQITNTILASKKYQDLYPQTVERIVIDCIKRYGEKRAEKEARNKLHQIWGAYWSTRPDFTKLFEKVLPQIQENPSQALKELMALQSSTKERTPLLETFYTQIFMTIGEAINSVSEYGCGLNPLTYLWIPNAQEKEFIAYDIDLAEVSFLNTLFEEFTLNITARPNDILQGCDKYTDVVFMLKLLPCLEQQQKNVSKTILAQLQCKYAVISFPTKTIGGKPKGMDEFYSGQFEEVITELKLNTKKIHFSSELVYIIKFH
nr:Ribosomal RNA methyltransferase (FmrO) [uncultured bacterium]